MTRGARMLRFIELLSESNIGGSVEGGPMNSKLCGAGTSFFFKHNSESCYQILMSSRYFLDYIDIKVHAKFQLSSLSWCRERAITRFACLARNGS